MMPTVLHITPYYTCTCHPFLTPYLTRLIEGIARQAREWQVIVVSTNCRYRFSRETPLPNLQVLRVPAVSFTRAVETAGLAAALALAVVVNRRQPIIAHAHWMEGTLSTVSMLRRTGATKAVCTIHESIRLVRLAQKRPLPRDPKTRRLLLMDRIVVPSSWSLRTLIRCGVPKDLAIVIPHGIDVSGEFLGQPKGHGGHLNIVFAKHLEPLYGADMLPDFIQAVISRVPSCHFHIVGDGSLRPMIWEKISRCETAKKSCTFHGYISNEETRRLMAHCDVFVSLSRYESFGVSTLEAMASGDIVLVTDIATNRELLGDTGFTFPLSSAGFDAAAGFLSQLSRSPSLCEYHSKRCLDRVAHYPLAATVSGHLKMYESLFSLLR